MTFLPLYIDPGTGSMLFSLFIGIAAAASFALRALFIKLRFIFSAGKANTKDSKNIPFVIFSDHKRYWNVFHGLCDEFERHGVGLVYYTCSPDDTVLSMPYTHVRAEFIGEGNKPYARMNMLHADIVVATTPGLDVYQWRRSRYVKWYVHIPHAVRPLYTYRMFGTDHYDAVLCTGQNQVTGGQEIEAKRPSVRKKEYVIVGSPTMDNILSQRERTETARKTNGQICVLVAPSWGKSGILSKFGARFLSKLSETGYEVIVRPHPQSTVSEKHIIEPLMEQFKEFEWNFDDDNFSVLNRADILISDFSGTMFDFAFGFGKPIIYADVQFDTAPYDAAWLEKPIWEFTVLPEIGIKLEEEDFGRLRDIINGAVNERRLKTKIDTVRKECWENVGCSARAEFDYLLKKQEELKA